MQCFFNIYALRVKTKPYFGGEIEVKLLGKFECRKQPVVVPIGFVSLLELPGGKILNISLIVDAVVSGAVNSEPVSGKGYPVGFQKIGQGDLPAVLRRLNLSGSGRSSFEPDPDRRGGFVAGNF